MNRTWNAITFLMLLTGLAAPAPAQRITYQFTGTKVSGSTQIGNTIAGTLTLDLNADFDYSFEFGCGEYVQWKNGGLAIEGLTDTGFQAGTSCGGDTFFWNEDYPCFPNPFSDDSPYRATGIVSATLTRSIQLYTEDFENAGDGIAEIPVPWRPFEDQLRYINIAGETEEGLFSLDTFNFLPATILVAGRDTGIPNFIYQGNLVTQHLDHCAIGVKNHGQYVSCVTKLTNKLKKAGLLTGQQKGLIVSYAAQSNIGKKK